MMNMSITKTRSNILHFIFAYIYYRPPGGLEVPWVLLLRPEMRNLKNGLSSRSYLSVRYPTKDTLQLTNDNGNLDNASFIFKFFISKFIAQLFSFFKYFLIYIILSIILCHILIYIDLLLITMFLFNLQLFFPRLILLHEYH